VWRSNQIKNSLLNLVFVIYVRDESNITKTVISMNLDGHPRRGRPKKRWMDCVNDDMRIKREHGDDE
jgi:hypothetical protein